MSEITSFINSCGFPIFVTVFLLYQQTKQNDIIAANNVVISANTAAINRLSEQVEELKKDVADD